MSDQIRFSLTIENTTDQEIRAFTGKLRFADVLSREIYNIELTYDDPLPTGIPFTTNSYAIDYNQFVEEHEWLRNTAPENMIVTFDMEAVLFTNGIQIGEAN
ncbi:MAG: hypothetical protein O3A33_14255 [Chloroflexi bacterium]|nr:hypothetical protein [Chloroflexota bacterium]